MWLYKTVNVKYVRILLVLFSFHGVTAPSEPRPPHCRGFMITMRHAPLGMTPLDE
jgi:hypothetical protein